MALLEAERPFAGGLAARARTALRPRVSPELATLLVCLPILFVHVEYQPGIELGLGSASASIVLSDLAVLAVALAALRTGLHAGFGGLRAGLPVWLAGGALLALIGIATLHPLASGRDYPFAEHLVTGLKWAEYAALAPAVALLVRRREDVVALVSVVVGWSVAATFWALLQFSGLVTAFGLEPVLDRVPSFVGFEDFALLSAAAVCGSLVALARGAATPFERAVAWTGGISGGLGVVLSGAIAGVLGLGLAAAGILALVVVRRELRPARALALAGVVVAIAGGTSLMRAGDLGQFFEFVGLERRSAADAGDVQSYSQRTVLAYVGLKIFLDHPLLGVGWQGSLDADGYGPQLAAARARFPDEPDLTFPSPEHPWGVHNAYVQALSDLGLPGLALLAALLAGALAVGTRAALRAGGRAADAAFVATAWLLLVAGLLNATGLVAGIPLDAMLWLSAGLAAAAAAEVRRASA